MIYPTKEEKKWIKRVQRALNACPSDRLGFYTIGDPEIAIYDRHKLEEFGEGDGDFCVAVDDADAQLDRLVFPQGVVSSAG